MSFSDELRLIVREEVRAALREERGAGAERSEFIDAAEVAKILGVNPRSVQKFVTRDGLPAYRVGPKLYRFLRTEVEAWLLERSTRNGSHARKHLATLAKVRAVRDGGGS